MPDFVMLTCPSCNGRLQVTQDTSRFTCAYCGNEYVVKRTLGAVSLRPVVDVIAQVKASVDRAAGELARQRLQRDASDLQAELDRATEGRFTVAVWGIVAAIAAIMGVWLLFDDEDLPGLVFIAAGGAVLLFAYYSIRGYTLRKDRLKRRLDDTLNELKNYPAGGMK
ncbi:MAG: hypothetical protein ACM3PY_19075 [Omnitrophica WOR_2 bacterium]